MKKKSTSQSAFFNLRVLVGLFIALAGVSLALVGFAARPAPAGRNAPAGPNKYRVTTRSQQISPLVPPGFDCSKIRQLGIDRMESFRAGAIMIFCGLSKGGSEEAEFGSSSAFSKLVHKLMAPLAYGGTDVDLVTGTETPPHVIQSETYSNANPDNPDEIIVAFNDSRGANSNQFSGASISLDGGLTFTRITTAGGQGPFPNTFGDPVILYNKPSGTWFTVWIDGNSPCTLGGYKSTTPEDPNSWTHFCVHNNGGDDRESGWADNNPSSPFFGRMYVSWNDFNVAGGALVESFSSDNGNTWSSEVQITNAFIRNTQITGDMSGNGTIYIAGMDEGGGGFPHNDINKIFKSTDGGASWSNTYTGSPFPGPGVTACSDNPYFTCMFPDAGGFWRHEGWGEPAAFNNVVSLVYAQQGTGSDPGDVYYIRSTDGGVTFGTPLKLNTDATTRPQWQPNLSVSPTGTLLATWYDARESASCVKGDPNTPCYRMWSRKSNDNGASWLPDDMLSDVVSPLPGQSDPNIVTGYAGDYDYGSAIAVKHVTSWVDGRVAISGQSQQDAFTDRDLVGFSVTTADPACGSLVVGTAPTAFIIDLSDPADPATVQATDFTVNGTPADSFTLSNGNATIEFDFNTSPVVQGENTMHIDAGAIHQASNNDPILEFNCTFRYGQEQLMVTDTNPPVGGTFTPPAPGTYTYDVNWNIDVDPSSVTTSDLQMSGNATATVTAVTVTGTTTEFTLQIAFGGSLTAHIAAGAITDTFGNPNTDFSGSYIVEGTPPCLWSAGPNLPSVGTRIVGVFFSANGKFYGLGGRSSDTPGNEFTHPFEYDPGTNAWTIKSATYPDIQVNNMACGVLNESGTDYIYCVGGSDVASQTTTGRVFRYDPVTDTLSSIGDPWPPGATTTTLPGGFTVANNKLYTLGGFNIPGGNAITDIWEFDPSTNAWVQKGAVLLVPLGYIPTTTISGLIYTGGGSDITGGLLTDTTNSFKYDPVADSISTIAPIPRATGETRALNFNGLMYVMGGGRTPPNPSNEVDIYDPGSNTWSTGIPFVNARRNFPTDTDGTTNIWLTGGYDSTGVPTALTEIFNCPQVTPTPTPTVTPTPSVTPTPTPGTPTPTPTVTATPTPRPTPTARPRPTPHPRP